MGRHKSFRKFTQIVTLLSNWQQSKALISILILLIIGLHVLPVLQELQGRRQTFWPVMAWGMYRKSYDSEQPIQGLIRHTIGLTSTGEALEIEAIFTKHKKRFFHLFRINGAEDYDFVGLGLFALRRLYLGPMWRGDSVAAQRLADRLNRGRQAPIREFRLESESYTLTDTGVVKEVQPVLTYRVVD